MRTTSPTSRTSRRAARGANCAWLDNVLIVAPSREFLKTLPNGKLPDRGDFKYYGMNQIERIRAWRQAMAQGQRMRDEFAEFVRNPVAGRILPL